MTRTSSAPHLETYLILLDNPVYRLISCSQRFDITRSLLGVLPIEVPLL